MENGQGQDPYVAVLADLKAQRDRIDQAISVLTGLRGGGNMPTATVSGDAPESSHAIEETAGMFLGMSIPEAAKKLLASRKKTLTNSEIASALKLGGLAMTSVDPQNTVGSVLTRRFKDVGDIVRMGRGTWGLKEWYPGRTFKFVPRAGKSGGNGGDADSDGATDVGEGAGDAGTAE